MGWRQRQLAKRSMATQQSEHEPQREEVDGGGGICAKGTLTSEINDGVHDAVAS